MAFITAAQTCPLSCQRLEASACEYAWLWLYVNMFIIFICAQLRERPHVCAPTQTHTNSEYVFWHRFGGIRHPFQHIIDTLVYAGKMWKYGLFSILTQLSFLLVHLICPPPALCVKRSRSWKINCLQRKLSDITPTLDSAHPICTQPTRLICSHCKCLLSPKQFFLDYVTSCWCPREFISRITFILD